MYLRTTAGANAGQIRDYTFGAAQAALKAGTAERVDSTETPSVTRHVTTPVVSGHVPPRREAGKRPRR